MPKVTIQRNTITGEMVSIEVDIDHPSMWPSKVSPLFDYIDARMIKLNGRVLDANKAIGNLSDVEYDKFRNILAGTQGYAIPGRQPEANAE